VIVVVAAAAAAAAAAAQGRSTAELYGNVMRAGKVRPQPGAWPMAANARVSVWVRERGLVYLRCGCGEGWAASWWLCAARRCVRAPRVAAVPAAEKPPAAQDPRAGTCKRARLLLDVCLLPACRETPGGRRLLLGACCPPAARLLPACCPPAARTPACCRPVVGRACLTLGSLVRVWRVGPDLPGTCWRRAGGRGGGDCGGLIPGCGCAGWARRCRTW
jgi:hypothetical protein